MIDLPTLAPRLVEYRLDNGLRLVMLPDRSSSLVAVNLWYHVGSKNDPTSRSGLAHLFEHMLFQGSANVAANEHFQFVQRAGGSTNASTSFDRTNYYETLPAHCLELGLWLESDRLGFLLPALTEEKFEGQRSVVINERRQRIENQPYGRAFETLLEELFPDQHPYSWPIIGHLEEIEAAELADVETFFSTHYSPDNAVLSLVGNIDTATTPALVERYFAEIPAAGLSRARAVQTPVERRRRNLEMRDDVALERIYHAWTVPALTDKRRPSGEILATILAGGKSSPLYQDLVHENQLAQDVSAFQIPMELASVFLLVATAKPGVSLERIEARLEHHIQQLSTGAPRSEDLERARNQVVTGVFEELQSVEHIADLLSRSATFYGDPAAADTEISSYLEVDGEAVTSFCADFLAPHHSVHLRVLPLGEQPSDVAADTEGVDR